MSRGYGDEEHGGEEMNALMVVNPREEIMGDNADRIMDAAAGYEGSVYRLDNIDRMEEAADFYDQQEQLMDRLYEIADEGEHVDPFWYDEALLFDNGGLDRNDQREATRESSTLEFLGGPLEDIAAVIASLEAGGQDASYVLNQHLTFDYGAWNQEQGYVEDEFRSLGELMDADEKATRERLAHHRLDRENIHF